MCLKDPVLKNIEWNSFFMFLLAWFRGRIAFWFSIGKLLISRAKSAIYFQILVVRIRDSDFDGKKQGVETFRPSQTMVT